MVLEVDNKGAIDWVNSWSVGGQMRHIDVRHDFLRDLCEDGILVVRWIAGPETAAISSPRISLVLYSSNTPLCFVGWTNTCNTKNRLLRQRRRFEGRVLERVLGLGSSWVSNRHQ
jgi:hypothetical protein